MTSEILNFEDFIDLVLRALEEARVDYLIGGAVAAWAWGEPRSTMDLDLVVNIPIESIEPLSTELASRDMLVPAGIILDNILETRADLPIHAIHMYSGYRADIYPLRAGDELRASAFQRRQKVHLGDPLGEVYLHSPEDLIIYKMWYFSLGQQTKHVRDVTAIVLSLGDALDYSYIDMWMGKKGLTSLWNELRGKIEKKP